MGRQRYSSVNKIQSDSGTKQFLWLHLPRYNHRVTQTPSFSHCSSAYFHSLLLSSRAAGFTSSIFIMIESARPDVLGVESQELLLAAVQVD